MRIASSFLPIPILAALAAAPLLAHSYGPPARVTGAPGDEALSCTLCHSTSPLNSGKGSAKIALLSGPFYIPGIKQRVAVQVLDPDQQRWGFELSARVSSDKEKSKAGEFTSVDNFTQVICEDWGAPPCLSGPAFIQNTSAGTRPGTRGGVTFQFDWTPPATNVGPIMFYLAANAANGNNNNQGDLIYTSSLQLDPLVPKEPSLTSSSIVSSATSAAGPLASNSWVTIYGTNLSATTRSWSDSDFVNGALPTSLDGVSVVLNIGRAPRFAYVGYVSPTQINFLMPYGVNPNAALPLQVKNAAGITAPVNVAVAVAPQLFSTDGKSVAASRANGAAITKDAPATPGETVSLFATGMGPSNPDLIPNQVPVQSVPLATLPTVTIGGTAATVVSASVLGGTAGVYQINVVVPSGAANGDLPVAVRVAGTSSASLTIPVQK